MLTYLTGHLSINRLLKFLHALNTGLLVRTTNRVESPSPQKKQLKSEHLKLGLKFHICACVNNFGGSGLNLTRFYSEMWFIAGVIMWTLILQGVPPTKFGRVKTSKIQRDYNNFRFWSQIQYLRNGSTCRKSEKYLINYISSPIGQKIGELWSTNQNSYNPACWPTQLEFFRLTIFWLLGCCPLKFLHALLAP